MTTYTYVTGKEGLEELVVAQISVPPPTADWPHHEALSKVATEASVEDDFAAGLRMLHAGIAMRSR